jgi:hypothetical protein
MEPKIRLRIPLSLIGVEVQQKGKRASFQEGFVVSGNEFRSRQCVGAGWRLFLLRAGTFTANSAFKTSRMSGSGLYPLRPQFTPG